MIPKNVRDGAVSEGLDGERAIFQIEANGKAFRTLIDGLYSNKIRSVIRELSSNARDSHIEANQDRPFEVYLPTSLDPVFRVRDFGVSLDHKGVMELYTRLFKSTKETTNDLTGQLGLGSKSPFAYTDTFSVVAYLDGVRRVYVAYLETDGVPCITHVSDEPSSEPQGLEVSFPAKSADLGSFQVEARYVMLGYRPEEVTFIGMDRKQAVPVMSSDTWALYHSQDAVQRSYNVEALVRMGSVVYPQSVAAVRKISQSYTLIVDIPIGSAEVTASRESLSMDDDTRQTIRRAVEEAEAEVVKIIEAEYEAAIKQASRVKRAEIYAKYSGIVHGLKGATKVSLVRKDVNGLVVTQAGDTLHLAQYFGRASKAYANLREVSNIEVKALPHVKVVLDDPSVKLVRRFKRIQTFAAGRPHSVFVYSNPNAADRAAAKAWIKKCWEVPDSVFVDSATLPDCPPPPRAKSAGSNTKAIPKGQVWMSRRRAAVFSDIYGEGQRYTNRLPGPMQAAADMVDFKMPTDILWLNAAEEARLLKKGVISADRKLDTMIKKAVDRHVMGLPLLDAQTYRMVMDEVGYYSDSFQVIMSEFFPDVTVTRHTFNEIVRAAQVAQLDLQTLPNVDKMRDKIKTLAEEYPLLFQRSGREHFEKYIQAVKAAKKQTV